MDKVAASKIFKICSTNQSGGSHCQQRLCTDDYTVSKKTAPLKQVGINSVIFQIQKILNIRFVGNFILNKSCEFYYDDVTMTSFIGNK